jgi:hypothetical protein
MYGLKPAPFSYVRAEEAAEKGLILRDSAQGAFAGAKALLISLALSARLKSCPVTKPTEWSFFRSL